VAANGDGYAQALSLVDAHAAGSARVCYRRERLVRCRSDVLSERPWRAGARGGQSAPGASLGRQNRRARCCARRPERPELRGSLLALRSIARRVLELTAEERALAREIEALTRKLAPQLLDQPGVGPHSAAQLVLSWSHPGRIRSEAAFARLTEAAPIPASSGQTIRYRLDRSGDRKLNRALHLILVTRKRTHPVTIAYIERRTQEGKTRREATAASSATSPATSTAYSNTERQRPLDKHRSISEPTAKEKRLTHAQHDLRLP
jgi:transposase